MNMKRIALSALVFSALGAVVYSCKDMGSAPPRPALTASPMSVNLSPGASAIVTISGGNPPYSIKRQPTASLASATLAGSTLTITAAAMVSAAGNTSVIVKDSDSHAAGDNPQHEESEVEIAIAVSATAGPLFSRDVLPILTASCGVAGCHVPGGSGPMPLQAANAYANLVNVRMVHPSCSSDMRVLPGNAASSGIIKKLEGSTCGSRMPLGGSSLPTSQIDVIRIWINQGARNN